MKNVPQTFYFGGNRQTKWVVGKLAVYKKLKNTVNRLRSVDDSNNYGGFKTEKERYLPLMIGNDYWEPCVWADKAPKIFSFKITAPQDKWVSKGAFDMFVGKGYEECGHGRFGELLLRKPPKTEQENYAEWLKEYNDRKKNIESHLQFGTKLNRDEAEPLVSFNSGGFTGTTADKITANGRFFTSALFDDSVTDQVMCAIFWCKNDWMACSVTIEHYAVVDIAGPVYENQGGIFWNLTPSDLFALAMTIFSLIFFCVQCCCCCQIWALELKGGVVDEQAILEKEIKSQYQNQQNNSNNQQNQNNRSRSRASPRHVRRKTGSRSPQRKNKSFRSR